MPNKDKDGGKTRDIGPLGSGTLEDPRDGGLVDTITELSDLAPSDATPIPESLLGRRYEEGRELLGEGGMGAVWAVQDRLIGRRVALKVMRSAAARSPSVRAMFLREARVQGQLEHPAIVPVYDLGIDPDGAAYFTMKRVRGRTLAKLLADMRSGTISHAPRRLLTAFASICLAIDFAHRHGVVHRDLKPANIMIGDFGEVQVLDWGVARVLRDESAAGATLKLPEPALPPTGADGLGVTRAAGTPGYMAPEQAHGVAVGPTADVYGLGTILFEMMALRPLATLGPREVNTPIAPEAALGVELAAICTRATEPDPADRYQDARALHDELERYLDGERTLELRRSAAASHLSRARQLQAQGATAVVRKEALREIGRALALEPDQPEALRALYALFSTLPAEPPVEVREELAAQEMKKQRLTARTSAVGYALTPLFLPMLWWIGVRDGYLLGLFLTCAVAAASLSWWSAAQPTRRALLLVLAVSTLAFSLASTMYGPLVLVPTMIATNTMALALHLDARARAWAILISVLGVVGPLALSVGGLIAPMYAFEGGDMLIRSRMLALPAVPTLSFLALACAVTILRGARSAGEVRDELRAAEERLLMQRWQLRQLLPDGAA